MRIATLLHRTKFPRGTSLLEGVLAIGVLMIGVVGSLVLILTTINLGRVNQDRIVAQNLAREGMELAYAHRNAGALSAVEFAGGAWDKYLAAKVQKSATLGGVDYKDKYDLGDIDASGQCKFYDREGCGKYASDPNTQAMCTGVSDDVHQGNEDAIMCDVQTLIEYLYINLTILPPGCDNNNTGHLPYWDGSTIQKTTCNFSNSSPARPDIGDLSFLISEMFLNSFNYQAGYPTIALFPSGTVTTPSSTLKFFTAPSSTALDTGNYTLQEAWDNVASSQVYEVNGTFTQNVSGLVGAQPTKFYRVVTFQSVCKGRENGTGPYVEWVMDQNSAGNCYDHARYVKGWLNNIEAVKEGVLVTSEVRWPTPTSRTRVSYQEYLYDWINI